MLKKKTDTNMTEDSVTLQIEAANASNIMLQNNFTEHLSDQQSREFTQNRPREQSDKQSPVRPVEQQPALPM